MKKKKKEEAMIPSEKDVKNFVKKIDSCKPVKREF